MYIIMGANPPLPLAIECFLTISQYAHALIKQPTCLAVVDYIEFGLSFSFIGDLEVEPVAVAVGIDIILEQKVVVFFGVFTNECQIARLKPGVEGQVVFDDIRFGFLSEKADWDILFAHLPDLV